MDALQAIVIGFWVFIPALVPNSAAVLFGGGLPVDLGRFWRGKRVLGEGKTWRGLIGGVSFGASIGLLQLLLAYNYDRWGFDVFGPFPESMLLVFALALGALLGDLCGAFIKRRLGMERGAKAAGLDQYDFVLGSLLLALLISPGWFGTIFLQGDGIISLLTILVIVPVLHRTVNIIGHRLGLKKEPW